LEQAKEKLIFALDVPDLKEAVKLVKTLENHVGYFKIGLELFVSEGPSAIQAVTENSPAGIFLDLKLHDIPATVSGALRSVSKYPVRFVTIHCDHPNLLQNQELIRNDLDILGITVLTSTSPDHLSLLGFSQNICLPQLASERAEIAQRAGCSGAVCSAKEVANIRATCGTDFLLIVPGIRPNWEGISTDDQARTASPEQAIKEGADYIVVGRPIRNAKDPVKAAQKIVIEIEKGLAHRTLCKPSD
jgi:orotidine-5'-phosphate decarboxylase